MEKPEIETSSPISFSKNNKYDIINKSNNINFFLNLNTSRPVEVVLKYYIMEKWLNKVTYIMALFIAA